MENTKILEFQARRKYLLLSRLYKRRLDTKYQKLMRLGFHTPSGRKTHIQQLQEAYEAELYNGLDNLLGDVIAEFLGMHEVAGFEQTLLSTPNDTGTPRNPNQLDLFNPLKMKDDEK